MFELRTAISFLWPKKGQLSVSVVGLIAIAVIAAISWLVLVFFSTTESIEERWSEKIVGLLGPARVVPSSQYVESPWCSIDRYTSESSFIPRRLSQKSKSCLLLYDADTDPPVTTELGSWVQAHSQEENPVCKLSKALKENEIESRWFESTVCHLSIPHFMTGPGRSLSQYTCLLGFEHVPKASQKLLSEVTPLEVERLLELLASFPKTPALRLCATSLRNVEVIFSKAVEASEILIQAGTKAVASITFVQEDPFLTVFLPEAKPVLLPIRNNLPVSVTKVTLESPFIAVPDTLKNFVFSYTATLGYPVFLSKYMRQQGVRVFDTGEFQFQGVAGETMTLPFYVAGFFDPGILPIGSKLAVTSLQAVVTIQPELTLDNPIAPSGLVLDGDLKSIDRVQKEVQKIVQKISPDLFVVENYTQYETTADLYQQLESEKTLFRLLSSIIIVVACANIFSMLFILAHDRRKEIAISRAMGASNKSIVAIFVLAGLFIGLIGTLLGSLLSMITLHYLPEILQVIGELQGHEVLQRNLYGEIGSQTVRCTTALFTVCSVSIAASSAGFLAALRACRINVSEALRG